MAGIEGWRVDDDGFLVGDTSAAQNVVAPPPSVAVPQFFYGCSSLTEAAIKSMNELAKPYSYEMEGVDEMYRRLSHAMTVLLAQIAKVEP